MISRLIRPITNAFDSLVSYQRRHIEASPDTEIVRLRQQRREAEERVHRLDIQYGDINRVAFGREPWPRDQGQTNEH